MKVCNYEVRANASAGASFNSNPIYVERLDKAAIQAVWNGALTGTLKLQVSCDDGSIPAQGGLASATGLSNWTDVTGSSQATGGAAGNHVWDLETGVKWVRVVFTYSAGTSNMAIRAHAKGAY